MSERVPVRFLRTLLRQIREHGQDPQEVLRAAGLDFDPGNPGHPGWRAEVSALEYSRVYQQVVRRLQDGIYGPLQADVAAGEAFRMMCYCIISCPTLGQALRRAEEFYATFFEPSSQLWMESAAGRVSLGYRPAEAEAAVSLVASAYGLSLWHRFLGWLCGRPLALESVEFRSPAPIDLDKYRQLFQCPLHFDRPRDQICFAEDSLGWAVVQNDHTLQEFLGTAPYQLLMMEAAPAGENLAAQVRAQLGHDFQRGAPGLEAVSRALKMSAPTLRRRLRAEGTSFQAIKDEARCEAARLALERPDLPVTAVAELLGFTDASAFHRSFRKWTGMTPGQYRARRRRPAGGQ